MRDTFHWKSCGVANLLVNEHQSIHYNKRYICHYNFENKHRCYTQNPWSSGRLQILLILSRFEVVLIQSYLFSSFTWWVQKKYSDATYVEHYFSRFWAQKLDILETYSEIFQSVLRSSLKGSHKKYDETKYGRFCVYLMGKYSRLTIK